MTVDNFWLFKKRDREKDEPLKFRGKFQEADKVNSNRYRKGVVFDPAVIKKKIMTKPMKGNP